MKSNFPRPSARPRRGQSNTRIVAIAAAFVAVLAIGWVSGRNLLERASPATTDDRVGSVQLAPDKLGRCGNFALDNRSATLTPAGYGPCRDIAPAAPRPLAVASQPHVTQPAAVPAATAETTGGSIGRLNAIAERFRKP